jgi:hypothetical protein
MIDGGSGGAGTAHPALSSPGAGAFHRGTFSVYVTNWPSAVSPRFCDQARKADIHRARCRSRRGRQGMTSGENRGPEPHGGCWTSLPSPTAQAGHQSGLDCQHPEQMPQPPQLVAAHIPSHTIRQKRRHEQEYVTTAQNKIFSPDLKAIALRSVFLLPPTSYMVCANF